ncbi:hypothetical protein Pfo_028889 [Paulownia fortunei]|nr:hypothetical protein Pfo_028889 [Paulownia fortunei]
MEEDMEEQTHMLQESLDLQAKEKSFYEVIGKKYPPSPQPESAPFSQYGKSPNYNPHINPHNSTSSSNGSGYLIEIIDPNWNNIAVAADDCRIANDLLKQIREHSSPFGDGNQRLAHYFADGLEARLAGTGSQMYKALWPTFIQRIAGREGGPPKLKITGIEFPQPGFRPAERVEDTGRRLAHYAKTFSVPFEYNAIAQKWETIKIEDL